MRNKKEGEIGSEVVISENKGRVAGLVSSDEERPDAGLLSPDQVKVNERLAGASGKAQEHEKSRDGSGGPKGEGNNEHEKRDRRQGKRGREARYWRNSRHSHRMSQEQSQQAQSQSKSQQQLQLQTRGGSRKKLPGTQKETELTGSDQREDMDLAKIRVMFGKYKNVNNGKVLDEILRSYYIKKSGGSSAAGRARKSAGGSRTDAERAPRSVREAVDLVQGNPSPHFSPSRAREAARARSQPAVVRLPGEEEAW